MKTLKAVLARWAAVLMLALAVAAPASAQVEGVKEVEAGLTAVMAKNKPYLEMIIESQAILLMTMDHINAAFEHSETPLSKDEAQKWSAPWEAQTRARISAVKTRLATTPRLTAEEVREALGGEDGQRLGDTLARNSKLTEEILAAAERTVNQAATLAPLSAAGDAAATDKLAREMFAVSLYLVEIENQNLRLAMAALDERHPQKSLTQSILSTNLAAAEIQRVILRLYNDEPLQAEAAARRTRAHLAEAETAAKRIPSQTTAMITALEKNMPEDGGPIMDKMRTAFASYPESAKVELDGIRLLKEAASALAAEDLEGVLAVYDKLETTLERRIPLQMERASYLSQ